MLRTGTIAIFFSALLLSCKTTKQNVELPEQPKYTSSQEININTVDTIYISGTLEYASSKKLVI